MRLPFAVAPLCGLMIAIVMPSAGRAEDACTGSARVVGLNAQAGGLLNVRSGPGREHQPIGQIRLDDVVKICSTSNEWTEVFQEGGIRGWVSSRFLADANNASPRAVPQTQKKPAEVDKSNPWPDAYKRRDYQLGMTQSAFLATPYPDRDRYPTVTSICSDDPAVERATYHPAKLFSEEFKRAGVVTCTFVKPSASPYQSYPDDVGLGLGDNVLPTEFYFINADGESVKRLFQVSTDGNEVYYPSLIPAFMKAYGTPTADRNEIWQNRMGAKFDNRILEWSNGPSTITLQQRTSKVNIFRAEYTLGSLAETLNRRLRQASEASADKL